MSPGAPPATPTSTPGEAGEAGGDAWTTAARPLALGSRKWSFSPERLVVGDWIGAIIACFVALVAMAALSAAAMGIAGYDAEAGTWFKRMLAFVALAVGGSARIPHDQSFGAGASMSAMPLTFTLVGFGLLAWITSRRLKRAPHTALDVTLQAIRTLIVMVLMLVVVGFLARHGHRGSGGYVHVKVAYTAFFGACVTLATLGVTFFVAFGTTLPARARLWRDRLVGPAVGVFVLVATALVLATVYALVQILAVPHDLSSMTQSGLLTDSTNRRDELSALLGFAPNHALWMLMWAMGVPLTVAFGHARRSWTLTTFTDGDPSLNEGGSSVYWVLPPIAVILWIVAAAVAALHAPTPREGRRNGYRLLLLAPLLTSAIFVMAGLAVRSGSLSLRMHFAYWWAFLLGLVWAAGAGVLAPELVLRLPAGTIAGVRRLLVRRFGASPAPTSDLPPPTVAPGHGPTSPDQPLSAS